MPSPSAWAGLEGASAPAKSQPQQRNGLAVRRVQSTAFRQDSRTSYRPERVIPGCGSTKYESLYEPPHLMICPSAAIIPARFRREHPYSTVLVRYCTYLFLISYLYEYLYCTSSSVRGSYRTVLVRPRVVQYLYRTVGSGPAKLAGGGPRGKGAPTSKGTERYLAGTEPYRAVGALPDEIAPKSTKLPRKIIEISPKYPEIPRIHRNMRFRHCTLRGTYVGTCTAPDHCW